MEKAIEYAAGISLLIVGLSWLVRAHDWEAWFEHIRLEGRRKALTLGAFGLILSALIVGMHPVWRGGALLLTLIGIGGMLEGTLYLLFPRSLTLILSYCAPRCRVMVRFFGLIMILFGAIILCVWWRG